MSRQLQGEADGVTPAGFFSVLGPIIFVWMLSFLWAWVREGFDSFAQAQHRDFLFRVNCSANCQNRLNHSFTLAAMTACAVAVSVEITYHFSGAIAHPSRASLSPILVFPTESAACELRVDHVEGPLHGRPGIARQVADAAFTRSDHRYTACLSVAA